MPKRLTDTEKWKDPWFCSLKPDEKLFWVYICDNCDHAGIFKVNWPLINFHVPGLKFDKSVFKDRIDVINDGIWFIRKFVFFQQNVNSLKELNPNNKCHLSIINILSNKKILRGLVGASKPLARGTSNSTSNSKGKVKDGAEFKIPSFDEVQEYCSIRNNNIKAERFMDYYEARGWKLKDGVPMKSWKAVIRNWEKNEHKENEQSFYKKL